KPRIPRIDETVRQVTAHEIAAIRQLAEEADTAGRRRHGAGAARVIGRHWVGVNGAHWNCPSVGLTVSGFLGPEKSTRIVAPPPGMDSCHCAALPRGDRAFRRRKKPQDPSYLVSVEPQTTRASRPAPDGQATSLRRASGSRDTRSLPTSSVQP